MKFKEWVMTPSTSIDEASYKGNLGAMEWFQLINKASDKEKEQIYKAAEDGDWKTYKKLVERILGIKLL